jgi:gamma-glutamyl hydrolase
MKTIETIINLANE